MVKEATEAIDRRASGSPKADNDVSDGNPHTAVCDKESKGHYPFAFKLDSYSEL